MAPTEVKRCRRCRNDKQKDGADRCDRCIKYDCPCEDRRWPSPNRRLKKESQESDESQRRSRPSELNVGAANNQRTPRVNPGTGSRANEYSEPTYTQGNSNSRFYQSQPYRESVYINMPESATGANNLQPQMPSYFDIDPQQTSLSTAYMNDADVVTNSGFYQPPDYYSMPSTYSQQRGAYRQGRR